MPSEPEHEPLVAALDDAGERLDPAHADAESGVEIRQVFGFRTHDKPIIIKRFFRPEGFPKVSEA